MKFTLVLLIAATVIACALSCSEESWKQYKLTYNKHYNEASDVSHKKTYCEKLENIEAHNELFKKGEVTWEMGVNQFTDMTSDEIRANMFGFGG